MTVAAQSLVDIIVRENSNPHEKQNAISGLRKMAERAGSIQNLFANGRGGAPAPPPMQSFNSTRNKVAELEAEIDKLGREARLKDTRISLLMVEVGRLKDEVATLRSSMKTVIKADKDGTLPYDDFAYRVSQILGNKGWKNEMVEQSGIDFRAIERARQAGFAPKELVDILPTLKTPLRNQFSPEEVKKLRHLAKRTVDQGLAEYATAHFDKGIVTSAMIRKLRTDLKMGNGLYSSAEYGGKLPLATGRASPRPRFAWSDYPEVETKAATMFTEGAGMSEIAQYVSKATGHDVGDNQINQRVYNSMPPARMISDIGTGPLTWLEVWFIFKSIATGKVWLTDARKALMLPLDAKSVTGMPLDHLTPEQVAGIRALYRHRVKEK